VGDVRLIYRSIVTASTFPAGRRGSAYKKMTLPRVARNAREKRLYTLTMVSILIVNWNGKRFLADCLNSIVEKVTVPYEVVMVDNNSTDGSAEIVEREFPWVRLVRSSENLGFIRGSNLAARHAKGDYLLLLNNDTVLLSDIADGLKILDGDPKIGVVGAIMYGKSGEIRPSTGHFPSPLRLWLIRSMGWSAARQYRTPSGIEVRRVDWVTGAFLLTRAEAWRQVGGMDERSFMYCDDIDLCKTMSIAGLLTVQCPTLRYVHFEGWNPSRMGYLISGYRRYHGKFSGPVTRLHADFVLRTGMLLRLLSYGLKVAWRRDDYSRQQLATAWALNRNWNQTSIEGFRFPR
jgi:GT2 family glycosyltransferase